MSNADRWVVLLRGPDLLFALKDAFSSQPVNRDIFETFFGSISLSEECRVSYRAHTNSKGFSFNAGAEAQSQGQKYAVPLHRSKDTHSDNVRNGSESIIGDRAKTSPLMGEGLRRWRPPFTLNADTPPANSAASNPCSDPSAASDASPSVGELRRSTLPRRPMNSRAGRPTR